MIVREGSVIVTAPVVAITYDNGEPVRIETEEETYYVVRN